MELAIDTSSAYASVALADRGNVLLELNWSSGQWHTVDLVPNIESLLKQTKVAKKDISAVFVAIGPGSFNGLRVGISVAKGIAFSLNIPLVGINTLEIAALPFAFTKLLLCPIHGAGRTDIASAFYRERPEGWKCLEGPHITTADKLCDGITEATVFCGEIPDVVIEQLRLKLGEKAIIPPAAARLRRGGFLIMLGMRRMEAGIEDNAASLQPLYLRPPPITMRKVK
jgi:tRNA threonylcarbamoyl adenosine modification protein YeaZ